MSNGCVREMPPEVCTIVFKDGVYDHTSTEEFVTSRGEQMFIHLDRDGRVCSIELLGSKEAPKPCQDSAVPSEKPKW